MDLMAALEHRAAAGRHPHHVGLKAGAAKAPSAALTSSGASGGASGVGGYAAGPNRGATSYAASKGGGRASGYSESTAAWREREAPANVSWGVYAPAMEGSHTSTTEAALYVPPAPQPQPTNQPPCHPPSPAASLPLTHTWQACGYAWRLRRARELQEEINREVARLSELDTPAVTAAAAAAAAAAASSATTLAALTVPGTGGPPAQEAVQAALEVAES